LLLAVAEFGFGGEESNRAARCEDAEDNISSKITEVETAVLHCRKDLMGALTEATDSVGKRVDKLREMQAHAASMQQEMSAKIDAAVARFGTLSSNVELAMGQAEKKIAAVETQISADSESRHKERFLFRELVERRQAENDKLAAEVMEKLKKIQANEELLRTADKADREAEATHQRTLARQSQHLGALAGCRDELRRFRGVLEDSTQAAAQAQGLATDFLSAHDHSVDKNIQRDLARVESRGRLWDAEHFATFCDAFEPVHHNRVMLHAASVNVECELTPLRAMIKSARDARDKPGENKLKKKQDELREQKRALDADTGATNHAQSSLSHVPHSHGVMMPRLFVAPSEFAAALSVCMCLAQRRPRRTRRTSTPPSPPPCSASSSSTPSATPTSSRSSAAVASRSCRLRTRMSRCRRE